MSDTEEVDLVEQLREHAHALARAGDATLLAAALEVLLEEIAEVKRRQPVPAGAASISIEGNLDLERAERRIGGLREKAERP